MVGQKAKVPDNPALFGKSQNKYEGMIKMNERERQRANALCETEVRTCGNYITSNFQDALPSVTLAFVNGIEVFASDYKLFVLVHTFTTLLAIVDRTESTLYDLSRWCPDFATKGFDTPFMAMVKTKYDCIREVVFSNQE